MSKSADTDLSEVQTEALDELLSGVTIQSAAEKAGVAPAIIRDWLREDWNFLAAYNRGRREYREAAEVRLLRLASRACEALETALDAGDLRASLALLKGTGLLGLHVRAVASDDATELRRNAELEAREREAELEQRDFLLPSWRV